MDTASLRQYGELLRELELTALELRADGSVRLERAAAPWTAAAVSTPPEPSLPLPAATPAEAGVSVITSPMVGMVYVAPAENAAPFVEPGSVVQAGDVLCIIEAMKLMNEITAEENGVISEVLAVNGAVVEFGQPLFKIRKEPS